MKPAVSGKKTADNVKMKRANFQRAGSLIKPRI